MTSDLPRVINAEGHVDRRAGEGVVMDPTQFDDKVKQGMSATLGHTVEEYPLWLILHVTWHRKFSQYPVICVRIEKT